MVLLCLAAWQAVSVCAEDSIAILARDPAWLRLGHYAVDADTKSGWRSAIHAGDFFLAAGGEIDPQLELRATVAAFAEPVNVGNDKQHPQCRFPARVQWLRTKLPGNAAFELRPKCPAYEAWTRGGNIAAVSIVLANGYLGNPASYFGHTLLKFNFRDDQGQTRLMDVSVNYGAIVPKEDGPIAYIAKSVGGGYDGGFSHIHFYFHNHNYGDVEMRDLWEYRLDLPQDAVDMIVAHSWEVLGKRYTYHFFRLNCAYRMAEVVQVVDGLDIIPRDAPWLIPQTLVQNLKVARYRERPVLAKVTYYPSRQSRFYEKYRSLSADEHERLGALIDGKEKLEDAAFRDRPTPSRQALLDTLLDYYQFIGNPMDKAPREIKAEYAKYLAARYAMEPGERTVQTVQPESPHLGRPPGWVQTSWGHKAQSGNFFSLRLRPAYYDALDADSGHVQNSSLTMAETQLNVRKDRAYISRFELVGVDSVNPALTGLAGDRGTAIKLHFSAEQARPACEDCLVARMQGDVGYGVQWSRELFAAVYLGGALQSDRAGQGHGFGRVTADFIFRPANRLAVKASYERRYAVHNGVPNYGLSTAEARWSIDSHTDFRLRFEHDRTSTAGAGFGIYW